jgi:cyclophilin family peptidyl-prolyl cis-trans isomerase/HEAT repeat protein
MRSGVRLQWVVAAALGLALAGGATIRDAQARRRPMRAAGPRPSAAVLRTISEREGSRDTTGLAGSLARDPAPDARAAAALALGRVQDPGSRTALEYALSDPAAVVRARAAFALGLLGDSAAAGPIVRRLDRERDHGAREAMVTTLGALGSHLDGAPAVAKSINAKTPEERQAAALAAARCPDEISVGPLLVHASEPSPEMRWRVAYALGRIGSPRSDPALRRLAHDPVETVRAMAARALGEARDSAAVPELVKLLEDRAWRVRVNAAHALGVLGAGSAGHALAAALRDPSAHVRWEAALALGALRDSTAAPALRRALADTATGVAQGAAISLLRLQGDRAVPLVAPELDLLPPFLRSGLAEALGQVPGPLALETLLARARDDSDPAQAAGAASGLGIRRADSAAVVPALRSLLQAKDFTVVSSAADALGGLRDASSVRELAGLADRHSAAEDADIRASAAGALASIKSKEALEALGPLRHDPERRIRETACAALDLPPDSVGSEPRAKLRVDLPYAGPACVALLRTERGVVEIQLEGTAAPRTVANFIRLARAGYFDGITFHRVVPNFVVQAGCPRGDGWGGPGYAIPCEYNDRPYRTGTVGMALSGKDTGGSQWFITLSPQPRLEGRYTVFGQVSAGMDVVERLMPGDRILRVTIR